MQNLWACDLTHKPFHTLCSTAIFWTTLPEAQAVPVQLTRKANATIHPHSSDKKCHDYKFYKPPQHLKMVSSWYGYDWYCILSRLSVSEFLVYDTFLLFLGEVSSSPEVPEVCFQHVNIQPVEHLLSVLAKKTNEAITWCLLIHVHPKDLSQKSHTFWDCISPELLRSVAISFCQSPLSSLVTIPPTQVHTAQHHITSLTQDA